MKNAAFGNFKTLALACFIFNGYNTPALAQEVGTSYTYKVNHYTIKSGLSHNQIIATLLDDKGRLWVQTKSDIHIIVNGKTTTPQLPPHIPRKGNHLIFQDQDGIIWFCSEAGFLKHSYQPIKEQEKLNNAKSILPFKNDEILFIHEARDQELFIYLRSNKIILFRGLTDFDQIDATPLILKELKNVYLAHIDKESNFYFGAKSDSPEPGRILRLFNSNGSPLGKAQLIKKDLSQAIAKNLEPENNRVNKSRRIWQDLHNDLFKDTLERFEFNKVVQFNPTDQLSWVIKGKKLIAYHIKKGIQHEINLNEEVKSINKVISSGKDLFVSTIASGILHIQINKKRFTSNSDKRLTGSRNITKDKQGNILLRSGYGAFILDSKLDIKHMLTGGYETINPIIIDDQQNIWLYGRKQPRPAKGSFFLFNQNFQFLEKINIIDLELNNQFVGGLYQEKSGTIWFSTKSGLYSIQQDGKSTLLNYNEPIERVFEILKKDDEHFWLCSNSGLYIVHKVKGIVSEFSSSQNGANYLPASNFLDFYIDKDEQYWLATADAGLIKWQPHKYEEGKQQHFKQFPLNRETAKPVLTGIEEDDFGYLWISTENGLVRMDKTSHNYQIFYKEDGIVNDEFNRLSHFKDENGKMYFGGISGITTFHPKDFNIDTNSTQLNLFTLHKYQDGNKLNITSDYFLQDKIIFNSNNNHFELDYFSSNWDNGNSQFSYCLNNSDNWILDNDQHIVLMDLPYGEHKLFIKEEGISGKTLGQLQIPIIVPRPAYLQNWFFLLIGTLLISIFFLIIKARIYHLKATKRILETQVSERTAKIEEDKLVIEKQAKILENLYESKNRFFTNIAHELRNPLTLILGSAQVLEQSISKSKNTEALKYVDHVKDHGNKILSLANEVLQLSKLESDPAELNKSPISLLLFIKKIYNAFLPKAEFQNKKLNLDYKLADDLMILTDVGKLEKIITNLLSNAFKYTSQKANINFLVSAKEENQLIIEISDNGYGISKKDLPFVFEPFFRSSTLSQEINSLDSTGGIGIGLAVVKEYTDLLKGKISVNSILHEGTIFKIVIPIEQVSDNKLIQQNSYHDHDPKTNTSEVLDSINTGQKIYHLLVVDDHEAIREFIQQLLEPYYHLSLASNGIQALEILESNNKTNNVMPISLIISDIMMPEMDGVKLLQRIKANTRWKDIPIIFLTGYTNELTREETLRIGIDDYLIKPFDPTELLARVQNSLTNNAQRKISSEHHNQAPITNAYENSWMKDLNQYITKNINNYSLTIETLADEMAIGKRQLTRKVKQNTGLTPGKYILEIRLQKARELLEKNTYHSVSAVGYSVGFKSPSYFSKQYKIRFGKLPSSYFNKII